MKMIGSRSRRGRSGFGGREFSRDGREGTGKVGGARGGRVVEQNTGKHKACYIRRFPGLGFDPTASY